MTTTFHTDNNKRQFPRVSHQMLSAAEQAGHRQASHTVDFSLTGVKLALDEPVDSDQLLNLRLLVPEGDLDNPRFTAPLEVKARIAWQRKEGNQYHCGTEFLGLTGSQKRRLKKAYAYASQALAASLVGMLLHATPAMAATSPGNLTSLSAAALSADVLAAQRSVNSVRQSLEGNIGRAVQDILNLQKGSSNQIITMMQQASLAANVAKLSADGIALKNATDKLTALINPTLNANNDVLRAATTKYEQSLRTGNTSQIKAAEAELKTASDKANAYVRDVFGGMLPTFSDQLQTRLTDLAKDATSLGVNLLKKDKAAIDAGKAKLNQSLTSLAEEYVAMTKAPAAKPASSTASGATPTTDKPAADKPSVMETVTSIAEQLDKVEVKQADGSKTSVSAAISSFITGLFKSPAAKTFTSALPGIGSTAPKTLALNGGAEVGYMEGEAVNSAAQLGFFGKNSEAPQDKRVGYAMLTDKHGTTMAMGYGQASQYSQARAQYGDDDLARMSDEMRVANMASVADGGGMLAYGAQVDKNTRVSASWSGSSDTTMQGMASPLTPTSMNARASNLTVAVAHKLDDKMTLGASASVVNEQNSVLGNAYNPDSALSFGASNRTVSVGLSAAVRLSEDSRLLAEANFATTRGGQGAGLVASTSDIKSRAYGMSYMSKNLVNKDDRLTASIVKPLRISSGQVGLALDGQSAHAQDLYWVSLAPTGSQTDYRLAYDTPLKGNQSLSLQATVRKDLQNIAGNNEVATGVTWKMKF